MDMITKIKGNIVLLNTLTGWIDKVTSMIVNFIIKPITLSFLGTNMFGVLEMLSKMTEFMASADFRSATTVKWILSVERETTDKRILNKKISAGFFSNVCILPIFLFIGAVIVYLSPLITKVDKEFYLLIRSCSGILVSSFIITQVFFIYEQILQGMNMAYKRIGVRAGISIMGGLLTYYLLYLGLGLLGVVLSQLSVVIITGLSYWFVVRENIGWVKIERVSFRDIFNFIKISLGFMIEKLLSVTIRSIDVLFLGYFLTTTCVSQYAISSYVCISLSGFILMFMSSFITHISPKAFLTEKQELLDSRSQMWFYQLLIYSFFLILILLFNKSFVSLWSSSELFIGKLPNLFIALYVFIRCITDTESSFLCMFMNLKTINKNAIFGIVMLVILSVLLITKLDVMGLLIGLTISQIFVLLLHIRGLKRIIGHNKLNTFKWLNSRFFITVIILIIISFYLCDIIIVENWISLIFLICLSILLLFLIYYYVALDSSSRTQLIVLFKK